RMRFGLRHVVHGEPGRREIGDGQLPRRDVAMTTAASPPVWRRLEGFCQRATTHALFRRPLTIEGQLPIISFTFDDFPRSAWLTGGAILERWGLRGTYYVSLGLIGQTAPTGAICLPEDVRALVEHGHELGSHTFDHRHSWETRTAVFERSILENQAALNVLLPGASFRT